MNIEEAIKVVRNIKTLRCKECVFDNDTKCIKENGKDCQEIAIETLLTAYEKEKEKNKELEKMIKKDEDALQFKVGDIVRLKYKSPCTFAIEEGAVCKITNIERQARYPIEIENKFNGVKGYVAEDYIEKIEEEE